MNVDVPGRLSLVGYDNTYLARLRSIWLTSVDSAGFEAGRLAARTLLARVADPARPAGLHLLPPALEVRGSTRAPARLRYFAPCVSRSRMETIVRTHLPEAPMTFAADHLRLDLFRPPVALPGIRRRLLSGNGKQ